MLTTISSSIPFLSPVISGMTIGILEESLFGKLLEKAGGKRTWGVDDNIVVNAIFFTRGIGDDNRKGGRSLVKKVVGIHSVVVVRPLVS